MTATDLCVNKLQFIPVIFEPPCTCIDLLRSCLHVVYVTTEAGSCKSTFMFLYTFATNDGKRGPKHVVNKRLVIYVDCILDYLLCVKNNTTRCKP
jgi:hypothetical protein